MSEARTARQVEETLRFITQWIREDNGTLDMWLSLVDDSIRECKPVLDPELYQLGVALSRAKHESYDL